MTNPIPTEESVKRDARDSLRKQLISARRALSEEQVQEYSAAICHSVLSLIKPSHNVAGYLALGNEVRIDSVLAAARKQFCTTYVPIMQSQRQMMFAKIDDELPLIKNNFGILEPNPATAESIPSNELDIVLVPLVGFDKQCQRMGMGGGYYDRAFAPNKSTPDNTKNPFLIGIAYDVQQTDSVMPDWWDVPLDMVVTESRIIKCA